MTDPLPVEAVLPELRRVLADCGSAVLVAPPGAGKTTAVAPALLEDAWCDGQIVLTSPRRVAARTAAERMAQMIGEPPGRTVGYTTRHDGKVSHATRIVIVTEAILVNRLLDEPELPGVSAILFDEAHERHLDSDLGLALALETRDIVRPDLRIAVMSATIDAARFARVLGDDVLVIESEGRSHPLTIEWLGSDPSLRVEDRVAAGVMTAWREGEGDILAFLPGVREIERTREGLAAKLPGTPILPLHGQVDPAAQRMALRRDREGQRRVVLATAIAETSLTLDGISAVVDSGLARLAEHDRQAGTTHLVTRTASRASAAQRAGRAARQGPGTAYRLWEEAGHSGRIAFAPPEIETADLTGLLLKIARRGSGDPGDLRWLDPPPAASVAAARRALEELGALDGDGRITSWGRSIAAMPMAPDHAAAILLGARAGCAGETARIVMLLQERGLGGRGEDVAQRLTRWTGDRSKRASNAARIAARWAETAQAMAERDSDLQASPNECLALARPDFVARGRDAQGADWLSAGGRGYQLDPASPLARNDWMVIGDAQGRAKGARITAGVGLDPARIEPMFADRMEERSNPRWLAKEGRVEARRVKRLGAITVSTGPDPDPDMAAIESLLVDEIVDNLSTYLPADFLARARFARISGLDAEALRSSADAWLRPLLGGRRDPGLPPQRLAEAALGLLDWSARTALTERAPTHFVSPAGTRHPIDYVGVEGPSVEVRVQALFGLDRHPAIGPPDDPTALLLKLTSPAGRPIQSTTDLPGFWRGSWAEVAREMKGRYPKHRWPAEPWREMPSLKTRNAFNRG